MIFIELENDYRPNTNHLSIPSELIKQYNKTDLNERISKAYDEESSKEVKSKGKKYNHFRKSTSDPNIQNVKFMDKLYNDDSLQNKKQVLKQNDNHKSSPNNNFDNFSKHERVHTSTSQNY